MLPKIELFDVLTVNDELAKEFNDFFYKWDLLGLFTDADLAGTITVTDSDARAVTNFGGAYNKDLKTLSEHMDFASDNLAFQRAVFALIEGTKSFQAFMNRVRKVNTFIETRILLEHQFNRWNIVYYEDDLI